MGAVDMSRTKYIYILHVQAYIYKHRIYWDRGLLGISLGLVQLFILEVLFSWVIRLPFAGKISIWKL